MKYIVSNMGAIDVPTFCARLYWLQRLSALLPRITLANSRHHAMNGVKGHVTLVSLRLKSDE